MIDPQIIESSSLHYKVLLLSYEFCSHTTNFLLLHDTKDTKDLHSLYSNKEILLFSRQKWYSSEYNEHNLQKDLRNPR